MQSRAWWCGGFVRGMKRAAHQQPRTPEPRVPCCPAKPRYNRSPASRAEAGSPCLSDQHSCIGTVKEPVGHPIPICAPEVIHGKTGPACLCVLSHARRQAPSGALLFRPFSWAKQEKGQGNRGRLGVGKIPPGGYQTRALRQAQRPHFDKLNDQEQASSINSMRRERDSFPALSSCGNQSSRVLIHLKIPKQRSENRENQPLHCRSNRIWHQTRRRRLSCQSRKQIPRNR